MPINKQFLINYELAAEEKRGLHKIISYLDEYLTRFYQANLNPCVTISFADLDALFGRPKLSFAVLQTIKIAYEMDNWEVKINQELNRLEFS